MTRTVAYHDYLTGTGEPRYRISFECLTDAEREAVRVAGLAVVVAAAFRPATPPEAPSVGNAMPPNCMDSGYALAHAQHSAATEGDDCTSGACLITRGSD